MTTARTPLPQVASGVRTAAINDYIAHHDDDPQLLTQLFIWTAKANDILKKVARCRGTSGAAH